MKNILLIITLLTGFTAGAQDLIVKSDGSIIKGKVTEVGEESVKYKKADNPDGPTYTVSKTNLSAINYENGEVEKFTSSEKKAEKKNHDEDEDSKNEDGESKPKGSPLFEDAAMKQSIEGITKDVGEQLLRSCANGKVDNSTSEVFWDQTFKDAITGDISIAMRVSWKPKWTDGSGKWIKGKILVSKDGNKKWVYQNDHGLTFSGCAKGFYIR